MRKPAVVLVDDQHVYKDVLARLLAQEGVKSYMWGCRECDRCPDPIVQPFSETVTFVAQVASDPAVVVCAIALDVNEYRGDRRALTHVLPALKSRVDLEKIPVIVYSSAYLVGVEQQAIDVGAAAYYSRALTSAKQAVPIILKHARRYLESIGEADAL